MVLYSNINKSKLKCIPFFKLTEIFVDLPDQVVKPELLKRPSHQLWELKLYPVQEQRLSH